MKCAGRTTLLMHDGIPFGIELTWGTRTEHEIGIQDMLGSLTPRAHSDGLLIACNRGLPVRLMFGRRNLDGVEQALLELLPDYETAKSPTSASALRKKINEFDYLWNESDDDKRPKETPLRGVWDAKRFAVVVRGDEHADALELLATAFSAEDVLLTYGASPSRQFAGSSNISGGFTRANNLGVFAPGLCPPAWRHMLANWDRSTATA